MMNPLHKLLITNLFALFLMLALPSSEVLSDNTHLNMKSKGHAGAKQSLLAECQGLSILPSVHCGRTPSVAIDSKGKAYVVFSQNGHVYLSTSLDNGNSYSNPTAVNRQPEAIYDDGENRPKIVLSGDKTLFVSWTHKTPGRYSGDVRFARSLDAGNSFSEPVTVNNDAQVIGHRFDSMAVNGDGRLYLFWIDKRDKQSAHNAKQDYLGAAIYFSYSDDDGKSFQPDKKWVDHSCECCRIAIASDSHGKVAILWRHVYSGNIRDHAIAYIGDEHTTSASPPLRATIDEWRLEGCPHHGPDLSFDSNNQAHMVWFTQGEQHKGLIYGQYNFLTQSTSLVKTIDSSASASRPQVQVIGEHVYVMWKRFNGQSIDLILMHSEDLGKTWLAEQIIANTANDSDHPDFAQQNKKLFAIWHTQAEGLRWISVK